MGKEHCDNSGRCARRCRQKHPSILQKPIQSMVPCMFSAGWHRNRSLICPCFPRTPRRLVWKTAGMRCPDRRGFGYRGIAVRGTATSGAVDAPGREKGAITKPPRPMQKPGFIWTSTPPPGLLRASTAALPPQEARHVAGGLTSYRFSGIETGSFVSVAFWECLISNQSSLNSGLSAWKASINRSQSISFSG